MACKDDGTAGTDSSAEDTATAETDADVDADVDSDVDADADSDSDTDLTACSVTIPASAELNTGDDAIYSADSGHLWVCGAPQITLTGTAATVYVTSRAEVLNTAGTGHTVWAESNARVVFLTSGNTVYHDGSARVDDRAGDNTIIECPGGVIFDRTDAPSGGC